MTSLILRTGKDGEIIIPKAMRKILNLEKNDSVSIEVLGTDIYIKKVKPHLRLVVSND